jgi:hypothetical protein
MNMQTKRRFAHRVTAAVGGTFAAALLLTACGASNDTPEGAVENFLDNGIEDFANAIGEGDFQQAADTAGDHLCAEDVATIQETADEFEGLSEEEKAAAQEGMGDEPLIPEDWSYEIGETTEDGDTATVEVEMTEDGETSTETMDLVKEDDEWKICGLGL